MKRFFTNITILTGLTLFTLPTLQAEIVLQDYLNLKDSLQKAFVELKPEGNHILKINPGNEEIMLEAEYIHASYSNLTMDGVTSHNVFLLGGYLRQPYMTVDAIALTACHELGHGLGGAPYKKSGYSSEGQSDYYATKTCLPILFKYIEPAMTVEEMTNRIHPQALAKCQQLTNNSQFEYCLRAMIALESHIAYYKYVENQYTNFSESSPVFATELNPNDFFYPEAQCRLDTSINGILGLDRPVCWFPAN